jgi:protocatechuate 3,4-dioxygenase alpha subunit
VFAVTVFARGLLDRLFTRAYLPGESLAADPFLSSLSADRRDTLIAVPEADGRSYRFDIRLQGEGETVFLDFAEGTRDR